MGRNLARLPRFVGALEELLGHAVPDEALMLDRGASLLGELVSYDDWLEDRHAVPHADRYQQYLLYLDPAQRFSVVSFVWSGGQRTPIHDHTVWGMVGMLRGSEISEGFELSGGEPVAGSEEILRPGDVSAFSPSTGDIHRVRNAYSDRVSISIHVYGGNIGTIVRHAFAETGEVKPFISGYSNEAGNIV
jgi:3-mercaptopropionate dioxygenase